MIHPHKILQDNNTNDHVVSQSSCTLTQLMDYYRRGIPIVDHDWCSGNHDQSLLDMIPPAPGYGNGGTTTSPASTHKDIWSNQQAPPSCTEIVFLLETIDSVLYEVLNESNEELLR